MDTTPETGTDLLQRYLALAEGHDDSAFLAQFADDAVVEDDGGRHVGRDAIAAWHAGTIPVRHDVRRVTQETGRVAGDVEISGAFPGSPLVLTFTLEPDGDGRIRHLVIRP